MKDICFVQDEFAAELDRVKVFVDAALHDYKVGKSAKAICGDLRAARRHINVAEELIKVNVE